MGVKLGVGGGMCPLPAEKVAEDLSAEFHRPQSSGTGNSRDGGGSVG